MQVRTYPDKQYTCDGKVQRSVSQFADLRCRMILGCVTLVAGSFVGFVLNGIRGVGLPTLVFTLWFGIAFVVLVSVLSLRPRAICPGCNSRMKPRYVNGLGSGEDLLLVCDHCKIYADCHSGRE